MAGPIGGFGVSLGSSGDLMPAGRAGSVALGPVAWPGGLGPAASSRHLSNPSPSITSPSGDLNPCFHRPDEISAILKQQIRGL